MAQGMMTLCESSQKSFLHLQIHSLLCFLHLPPYRQHQSLLGLSIYWNQTGLSGRLAGPIPNTGNKATVGFFAGTEGHSERGPLCNWPDDSWLSAGGLRIAKKAGSPTIAASSCTPIMLVKRRPSTQQSMVRPRARRRAFGARRQYAPGHPAQMGLANFPTHTLLKNTAAKQFVVKCFLVHCKCRVLVFVQSDFSDLLRAEEIHQPITSDVASAASGSTSPWTTWRLTRSVAVWSVALSQVSGLPRYGTGQVRERKKTTSSPCTQGSASFRRPEL